MLKNNPKLKTILIILSIILILIILAIGTFYYLLFQNKLPSNLTNYSTGVTGYLENKQLEEKQNKSFADSIKNFPKNEKDQYEKILNFTRQEFYKTNIPVNKYTFVLTDKNLDKPIVTVVIQLESSIKVLVYELEKVDSDNYKVLNRFDTATQKYTQDEIIEIAKKNNLRYISPDETNLPTEAAQKRISAESSKKNDDKYGGVEAKKERTAEVFLSGIKDRNLNVGDSRSKIIEFLKGDKGDLISLGKSGKESVYKVNDDKILYISLFFDKDPIDFIDTTKLLKIVAINKDRTEEVLLQ